MFDNDIKITGKHARYLKFLAKKSTELKKDAKSAEIFKRYIDVYMAGIIVGDVKNRKSDIDNSIDDSANILASAVIGEQDRLKFLYRLVLLTDNPSSTSVEDRIDNAFRYDGDAAKLKEGMAILNSYARGGIEWLYEKFNDGVTTQEDYYRIVYELTKEYSEDYYC